MMKFILLLLVALVTVAVADETPGFFIKLSKSVPRIGRRGDFENFFLKQSKSVPRIGRRSGLFVSNSKYKCDIMLMYSIFCTDGAFSGPR